MLSLVALVAVLLSHFTYTFYFFLHAPLANHHLLSKPEKENGEKTRKRK